MVFEVFECLLYEFFSLEGTKVDRVTLVNIWRFSRMRISPVSSASKCLFWVSSAIGLYPEVFR